MASSIKKKRREKRVQKRLNVRRNNMSGDQKAHTDFKEDFLGNKINFAMNKVLALLKRLYQANKTQAVSPEWMTVRENIHKDFEKEEKKIMEILHHEQQEAVEKTVDACKKVASNRVKRLQLKYMREEVTAFNNFVKVNTKENDA